MHVLCMQAGFVASGRGARTRRERAPRDAAGRGYRGVEGGSGHEQGAGGAASRVLDGRLDRPVPEHRAARETEGGDGQAATRMRAMPAGGCQGLGSWAAHRARGRGGVRTATAVRRQPPEAQHLAARLAVMGDARAREGVAVRANA